MEGKIEVQIQGNNTLGSLATGTPRHSGGWVWREGQMSGSIPGIPREDSVMVTLLSSLVSRDK